VLVPLLIVLLHLIDKGGELNREKIGSFFEATALG
jgi:hypothetical protein